MKEIGVYDFSLIMQHEDYIQFKFRYSLEADFWMVGGMGWINGNVTNYYLGDLTKNKKQATLLDIKKAGLVLQEYSLKFQHSGLDKLTKKFIESYWHKSRPRKNDKARQS